MKKLLLALLVLSVSMIGCTDKKKSENTLNVEQEQEVNRLDSETEEIENMKKDIEESSKELDELLNDIN
jgi:septal ring factor EnvC (AmiA/AmiB activator)